MPTLKELLNAFGKASARNAVPNAAVFSEIFPPNAAGDATKCYYSPCDGWIWVRFTACKWAIANGELFGGLNFETKETVGGFFRRFLSRAERQALPFVLGACRHGFCTVLIVP